MRGLRVLVLVGLVAACSGNGETQDTTASDTTRPPVTTTAPAETTTTAADPSTTDVDAAAVLPWWNERVFYEVFVRSFKDADGDGIGDLRGLTESLDYLNDGDPSTTDDLGVTGLWLMPIHPSPSYHGYDVTDYRAINPDYGTMADFEAFLDAAHERGIAVLIDLVINHSSREHDWFAASAAGDTEYADWYLWSATDPATSSEVHGGPAWHPEGDSWFFGIFWEGMPDLNLENEAVTTELYDVARFWLDDVGVDGFRLDAARHLIEDGADMSDTPATKAWLADFTEYVHSVNPDALVLGEVWSTTADIAPYLPDSLDLAFEFELSESADAAVAAQDVAILDDAVDVAVDAYPELQFATFLRNHDMDRMMSAVGGDVQIAKLAATWLLTSPGVPFMYYGEEVGLQGTKPDERIRTPMPWTDQPPGLGFTTGEPWEPVEPGSDEFNVADQIDEPDSLLSHYRTLVHFRADSTALRHGDVIRIETDSPTVSATLRSAGDDHILVVMNIAPSPAFDVSFDLPVGPLAGMRGVEAVVGPPARAPEVNATGGFDGYTPLESIPAFGFLVLRFTPEPSPEPPTTEPPVTTTTVPVPPASEADAAMLEAVLDFVAGDEIPDVSGLYAPDAVGVVDGESFHHDHPAPPDWGLDESFDWDGDGTVTIGEWYYATQTLAWVITTSSSAECEVDGPDVVCVIEDSDVFMEAAGIGPTVHRWRFRLVDGLVVRQEQELAAELDANAWGEQFAIYEQWVGQTHPDVQPTVFREPCCVGNPDVMWFTRESIEAQRALVPEWAATVGVAYGPGG